MVDNGKRSTRERILRAARDVFVEQGYGRTGMGDIASTAGVSRKTIYSYFNNKPELFREMFRSTIHEYEDRIEQVFSDKECGYLERFARVISLVNEQLGWLKGPLIDDIRRTFPDLWADTQEFRDKRVLDNFSRILTEGVERGVFRDDIDEKLLLMTWFAASQNVLSPEALSGLPLTSDEAFRSLLSVMCEGMLTPRGRRQYTGKLLSGRTQEV